MAVTSRSFPATDEPATPRPGAWLRVALLAAVPAVLVAAATQLLFGSGVLDHAVALEPNHGGAATAEPFTRSQQQGGMLLGNLLVGTGIAAMLAGALVLFPSGRAPRDRWLTAALAGGWGAVVVPAAAYPPLPPGVDVALDVVVRQWLFLGCVVAGGAGALAAVQLWRTGRVLRLPAGAAALAAPVLLAVLVLPDQRAAAAPDPGLVTEFRVVALGSQLAFWIVLAAVGALLLRRAHDAR